jgi:DNA-binding NtrC family response regulator
MANMLPRNPAVLLVDDDEALLQYHVRALASRGYSVDTAVDKEAMIRALSSTFFDIILGEVGLPGLSEGELLERAHLHNPDVPVVLMAKTPSFRAAKLGAKGSSILYLVTPVEPETLVRVVDCAIRHSYLLKAKRQAMGHAVASPDHRRS